jgi:UDP-N-acetylmuramoyl-tripeptide--D-alanyl-D-alanine ligase
VADRVRGAGARLTFDAASLAEAVAGRIVRDSGLPIRGGAVDSRRVEPGNIFFALPGERTDGHRFLDEATRRGAAALVVTRVPSNRELDALEAPGSAVGSPTVIAVSDAGEALRRAAEAWRDRFDALIIGVTGSIAKTSTKEQIAELLSERWPVLRNLANENNEIGLPLTLLRLMPEHRAAVLEMGMYTPGDIRALAKLAKPTIGVVTAVRSTHLARAGSIEAIERGKRELVEAIPPGGTAVLNADDARVAAMAGNVTHGARVMRYGFDPAADVSATEIESLGERGMKFLLRVPDGRREAAIRALGRHSVHNALAGAAVGVAMGLGLATIVRGLARPFTVPHRTTLVPAGQWRLLDDTYNAAPDSMIAALDLLASLPGRHVAVLGEMLELGEQSTAAHVAVGAHAARSSDLLVAVGPEAATYATAARAGGMAGSAIATAADRDEALALLLGLLQPGDVVLLKASRGAALDLLVDALVQAATVEPIS